jgi:hypothetical protein
VSLPIIWDVIENRLRELQRAAAALLAAAPGAA